jgi:hypothetical protein
VVGRLTGVQAQVASSVELAVAVRSTDPRHGEIVFDLFEAVPAAALAAETERVRKLLAR